MQFAHATSMSHLSAAGYRVVRATHPHVSSCSLATSSVSTPLASAYPSSDALAASPAGHGPELRTGATSDTVALTVRDQEEAYEPYVYDGVQRQSVATDAAQATQDQRKSWVGALRDIAALSIPALGSTLADPVCSLVDTACVGKVNTLELAALSPCTAIFNLVFLVFQFVGVTLCAKLAANSMTAPGLSTGDKAERLLNNKRIVSYCMTFAIVAGIATSALLLGFAEPILTAMGTNADMMAPALDYLRWRALAAPAVLLMNVCQGICLGQQNAVSPLLVFSAVGMTNVVLDIWLIIGKGMGCSGAAIATAVAQWGGALVFLEWLRRKGAAGKSVPVQYMGLPSKKDLEPFLGMAGVLLSRTIFSMAAFTIVTATATALGTVAAATHQVCLQLYWFLSYFPEPLSVSAQSLIARDSQDRGRAVMLTRCILGLAAALGLAIAGACAASFYFGSGAFTSNPVIAAGMTTIAPAAFASLLLCAIAMAFDGISIGSDNYRHLPVVNFLGLACTASWLLWCTVSSRGLADVWVAMVVMFVVRLSVHFVHHFGRTRRTSIIAAALGLQRSGKSARLTRVQPMQPSFA